MLELIETVEWLRYAGQSQAAFRSSSICRNQLITGFQLVKCEPRVPPSLQDREDDQREAGDRSGCAELEPSRRPDDQWPKQPQPRVRPSQQQVTRELRQPRIAFVDSIAEILVQSANFQAEYGRSSGASITVITRTGSKDFRGSAAFYKRDAALNGTPRCGRHYRSTSLSQLSFNCPSNLLVTGSNPATYDSLRVDDTTRTVAQTGTWRATCVWDSNSLRRRKSYPVRDFAASHGARRRNVQRCSKIRTAEIEAEPVDTVASENWRGVWDDFRNWLIEVA